MVEKVNTWLVRGFAILWTLFIFLEYLNYTAYVSHALDHFRYFDLLFVCLLVTAVLSYFLSDRRKKWWMFEFKNFRNIYLYLYLLLFMILLMGFYLSKTGLVDSIASGLIMFIIKSVGIHIGIAIIVIASYALGTQIVKRLPVRLYNYSRPLISIALGFALMSLLLFLFGAVGFLNLISVAVILLLMLASGYKDVVALFKNRLFAKNKKFEINVLAIIPLAVLVFCVAMTMVSAMRPLPTGFDSLTLYMNTPKLIAGYGALAAGGQAYNWSLIMSLGFIVFKSTAMAITLSALPGILSILVVYRIAINIVSREWALFACSIFYTFPNVIFQSRFDAKVDLAMLFIILCAVLVVFEHYYAAKKMPVFKKLKPLIKDADIAIWGLAGILLGFAFGIKYTALFSVLVFLVWMFYIKTGRWGAVGMFFVNFAIVFGLKLNQFSGLEVSPDSLMILIAVPLVIGLVFMVLMLKDNKDQLISVMKSVVVFGALIGFMFAPWVVKHLTENKKVSIDAIINGKKALPSLRLSHYDLAPMDGLEPSKPQITGVKQLDKFEADPLTVNFASVVPEINIDEAYEDFINFFTQEPEGGSVPSEKVESKKVEGNTAKYEEVNRYIGYEDGIIKFMSLPYDLTMKRNVNLWGIDMGLLFLLLLPLFVFSFGRRQLHWNVLKILVLLFVLISSIISVEAASGEFDLERSLKGLNGGSFSESEFFSGLFGGLYIILKGLLLRIGNVMMPLYKMLTVQSVETSFLILIVSTALIYFMYHAGIKNKSKKSKALILFIFSTIFLWLILGSGIIWYGIVGFALLPLIIAIFLDGSEKADEGKDKVLQGLAVAFGGLWFCIILPFQLVPIQMTMLAHEMEKIDFNYIIERPFGMYCTNQLKEEDAFQTFYGKVDNNIIRTLNSNNEAKVLNVYTSLKYHIDNNDIRVYEDNQLQTFQRVWNSADGDKKVVSEKLKAAGIKYILISLATPNMDNTPERTLNQKFNNLMNCMVNNPGSRLLYTNRIVERHDGDMEVMLDGKKVKAKYELAGLRVVEVGTVALYEIF